MKARRSMEDAVPHQPACQGLLSPLLAKRPLRKRRMRRDQVRDALTPAVVGGERWYHPPQLMHVDYVEAAQMSLQPTLQGQPPREQGLPVRRDPVNILSGKSCCVRTPVAQVIRQQSAVTA